MNLRLICLLAAGAALVWLPAQAAVSVIGSGPAELCYQAADDGDAPLDNLTYCDQALAGTLTDTDRAATLVNRGVLELSLNRVEQAASDFDAGLAINANMGEGYVDRAATLILRKRYADAIADINKGLALGSKQPQIAYFDRAMANESLGNLQGAYDDYHEALTLAPDFSQASAELARFKVVAKPSGA